MIRSYYVLFFFCLVASGFLVGPKPAALAALEDLLFSDLYSFYTDLCPAWNFKHFLFKTGIVNKNGKNSTVPKFGGKRSHFKYVSSN